MGLWQKIVCAVDFSEPSRRALAEAVRLADTFSAALTLVHVYEPPPPTSNDAFLAGPSMFDRSLPGLDAKLRAWAGEIAPRREIAYAIRMGMPSEEILHEARELGADLIVLGTHGRSGLGHLLLGSIAERVIRAAPVPVLVVRA
jgi:universal stress protein A